MKSTPPPLIKPSSIHKTRSTIVPFTPYPIMSMNTSHTQSPLLITSSQTLPTPQQTPQIALQQSKSLQHDSDSNQPEINLSNTTQSQSHFQLPTKGLENNPAKFLTFGEASSLLNASKTINTQTKPSASTAQIPTPSQQTRRRNAQSVAFEAHPLPIHPPNMQVPINSASKSVPAFLNKLFNMVNDISTELMIKWSFSGKSFIGNLVNDMGIN